MKQPKMVIMHNTTREKMMSFGPGLYQDLGPCVETRRVGVDCNFIIDWTFGRKCAKVVIIFVQMVPLVHVIYLVVATQWRKPRVWAHIRGLADPPTHRGPTALQSL